MGKENTMIWQSSLIFFYKEFMNFKYKEANNL